MSEDNQNSSTATYLTAGVGVIFILISVLLIILYPNPSPAQYQVFKIVLALACAGFAAAIPGAINVGVGHAVRAGGAMAVFVIIYFFSPAGMMFNRPTNEAKGGVSSPSPTPVVTPDEHAKTTEPALKNLQTPFQAEITYEKPDGLNVRKSPSSGAIIVKLLKGSKLTVQNKYVESNNYRWWPVRLDQGWIAEGETDLTKPRLLKALSDPAIGNNEQVVVSYSSSRSPGLSLRRDYDLRSETIAALLQGSKMTVIGGPQTKQGYIWWLVRVDDGWIAEGPTDDVQPRWLKPAAR